MPIETPSSRYSPVDTRVEEHIATTADPKVKVAANDEDGYISKMKHFLTTATLANSSKTKPSKNCNYSCTILFILGFILSLFLTIFIWFTDLYTNELYKRLTIQNGSLLYDSWKEPPVRPLLCVYIFNYTNVNEFINGEHQKLKVQEVGPYCYRETLYRVNITDHQNGSQTFNEMKVQEYAYDASNGKDNDIIIVPDIPYISAIALTIDENFLVRNAMTSVLNHVSNFPFVTVSVYDFCFGYQDSVIRTLAGMAKLANKPVPFEKFGLLSKRIGVNPDRLTVINGLDNLNQMGQVIQLNGKSMLHPWSTDECNSVGGSDGMFFPRLKVQQGETIHLFHKDSCRKLPMTFLSKEKIKNGVIGHRYSLSVNTFNNSIPENSCYCTSTPCMPDGIFDMGKCSTRSPVVVSRAHFLHSDPSLLNAVEGLNPDPEKHEFLWLIDPILGITMETQMRIQLNIQVRNPHNYGTLSKIPDNTILPFTWLEIKTGDVSPKLSMLLFHLTFTLHWFQTFLMCLSLVGLLGTSFCLMRMLNRRLNKNIVIISNEIQLKDRHTEKIPIC
ncbi:lysosome membrane protein 2-like [Rhopalosiphum padi]|uniref:lysosome membrane protein 2-like n=1 Tax=Rhopalosiphum padi TaxID=40932 RepID=UPI00298DE0CC|nr:lysosome membrane protein 2-like [Rhopalosiphum padi]XP_060837162.1 lysosome membrane protein 2-like [Rhopalosiphum padi]